MTFVERIVSVCTFVTILTVSLGFTGCGSTKKPEDMDPVEKAKRINELRTKADEAFTTFKVSEGEDIEALFQHAEYQEETTRINPGNCPMCFFNAAMAFRRVGNYHRRMAGEMAIELDKLDKLDTVPPELDAKFEKHMEDLKAAYVKSNKNFEVFLRQGGTDPQTNSLAYFELMDSYAGLEDFRSAVYYLDRFESSVDLDEASQGEIKKIRDQLQQRLLMQEEDELGGELELDDELKRDGRYRGPRQDRPQPGN